MNKVSNAYTVSMLDVVRRSFRVVGTWREGGGGGGIYFIHEHVYKDACCANSLR